MQRLLLVAIAIFYCTALSAEDGLLLDNMDELRLRATNDKAKAELVDGKVGKALNLSFADGCQNAYLVGRSAGTPAWDKAAGFSFWVKGDGSDHLGGLEFIWNEDFGIRYGYAFPISGTDWQKIVVPWRDLVPETSNAAAVAIDAADGNAPSKLSAPWFGKWWYWRDYAGHSFTVDEIRLEPTIKLDQGDDRPKGKPLARVLARLKAGEAVKIVTMGDSLTDFAHWANRETNWPTLLVKKLEAKYKSKITLVNPAIGGTELRQNLVLIPRWAGKHADADLVSVCFGGNDWNSGMRGLLFEKTCADAVGRIRRATGGHADVLIQSTCPSVEKWDATAELAEACRKASADRSAGLADIDAALHAAGKTDREELFASDKVHLGPAGHELFAETVFKAIESGGR